LKNLFDQDIVKQFKAELDSLNTMSNYVLKEKEAIDKHN
jgi:hypothetical protein